MINFNNHISNLTEHETVNSVRRALGDIELKIWDESNLNTFENLDKNLFDSLPSWSQKSDIVRYEALYRYGGLYIDTDYYFWIWDKENENYDIVVGLEAPEEDVVGTSFIYASKPGLGTFKNILDNFREKYILASLVYGSEDAARNCGPQMVTEFFARSQDKVRIMPTKYYLDRRIWHPSGYNNLYKEYYPYLKGIHMNNCSWGSIKNTALLRAIADQWILKNPGSQEKRE